MTSETEETALDLVQDALKIFHDIAAVDIGESEADEDHFRNSSRTYALAGPVTVGDIRKAALAYEQLAALSRAPEDLELGSSTRMTSPASRAQTPLSAGWQEIERNPPPHNKAVLLGWQDTRDGRWISEVAAYSTGQRWDGGFSNQSFHGSASHWMPVPAPPAEEDLSGAQRSELTRLAQDEPVSSPPSTGGAGEALIMRVGERIADEVEKVAAGRQSNCEQAARDIVGWLHPSPEMGVSREALARIIDPEAWEEYLLEDGRVDQEVASIFQEAYEESLAKADQILKLKENGLSREELGGLARSLPSGDAQERSPVPPLSDGGCV